MLNHCVPFRMHRSGWLIVAFCVLVGMRVGGWRMGLPVAALLVVSLLLHEVGHMLVATALGVPVREFGIRFAGAYNRRAFATRRRDEILISMAGPLMNLALVIPLLFLPHFGPQLALDNLFLCMINLLPIPSSDGLRIFKMVWNTEALRAMTRNPVLTPALAESSVR